VTGILSALGIATGRYKAVRAGAEHCYLKNRRGRNCNRTGHQRSCHRRTYSGQCHNYQDGTHQFHDCLPRVSSRRPNHAISANGWEAAILSARPTRRLLARIAAASGAANDLGLDLATYLLNASMLEAIERSQVEADSGSHRPMLAGLA
jgi:hypothetical protein